MIYSSTKRTPGNSIHGTTRIMHIPLALGIASLFLLSLLVNAAPALASGPGGNVQDPVIRAVDIAKPAVVCIITQISSQLVVHFSSGDVTFPQPGSSAGSSYSLELLGTGTFISSHGDILTADHVVNPPPQTIEDTAAQDVTNYINAHSKTQVTVAQVQQGLETGQLPSSLANSQVASVVFLSIQYTGPLTAPNLQSVPANIQAPVDKIEAQSAVDQSDVAIIHVNMNDMPSVQLGNSSSVQQTDQLTIIGFPGNGIISVKPQDFLNSSVNNIEVSSIKTTDTGAQVIQVGGNVEHGDSGGPALDSNGNIVGIVSFGLSTPTDPGGTSFLQASNSAEALVKSLNLDTTPGPFQKAWSQAFNDYSAITPGHWHKAAQELQNIATKYPLFLAIAPYLTFAQQQAKTEKVPTATPSNNSNSSSIPTYVVVAIGVIVVVLLLIGSFFAITARRRGKQKATIAPANPPFAQPFQNTPPAAIPPQWQGMQNQNAQAPSGINGGYAQPQPPSAPVPQPLQPDPLNDPMSAFGAPPTIPPSPQGQSGQFPNTPPSIVSGTLRPWPCGHMNRSNARYCSICGEPAPPASTIIRRIEQ